MAGCDKCEKELDEKEVAAYYDFPPGTQQHLCQECYDRYRVACAEQGVAAEDAEWAG